MEVSFPDNHGGLYRSWVATVSGPGKSTLPAPELFANRGGQFSELGVEGSSFGFSTVRR